MKKCPVYSCDNNDLSSKNQCRKYKRLGCCYGYKTAQAEKEKIKAVWNHVADLILKHGDGKRRGKVINMLMDNYKLTKGKV